MHIHLTKNTNNRFDIEGLNDPGIEKNGKFLKGINGYEGPLAKIFGWLLVLIGKAIYLHTDAGFALANKRSTENFLKRVFKQLPPGQIELNTLQFNDSNGYENLILIAKSVKQIKVKENIPTVEEKANPINQPKLLAENNKDDLQLESAIEEQFKFRGNEVKGKAREFADLIPREKRIDIAFELFRNRDAVLKQPLFFEFIKVIPEDLRLDFLEKTIGYFEIPSYSDEKIEKTIHVLRDLPEHNVKDLFDLLFAMATKRPNNPDEFHLYIESLNFLYLFSAAQRLEVMQFIKQQIPLLPLEIRRSLISLITLIPENARQEFFLNQRDLIYKHNNEFLINSYNILKELPPENRMEGFNSLKNLQHLYIYNDRYRGGLLDLVKRTPNEGYGFTNEKLNLLKKLQPILEKLNDNTLENAGKDDPYLAYEICYVLSQLDRVYHRKSIETIEAIIQDNPDTFILLLDGFLKTARNHYSVFLRSLTN